MSNFGVFKGFSDKLFEGELPTNLGTIGSFALYDVDAQAFFDRVITAGGTLSSTEKNAVNQLVLDMKSYSLWSKMKAIYPMVGASAAACRQNLKSSSFTGTFTSGWTFASTGATPNGTSAYMDTGLSPSVNLTNNSTHISYYNRTTDSGRVSVEIGVEDINLTSMQMLVYRPTYNGDQYDFNLNRVSATISNGLGFFIDSRTNSTSHSAYKNGISIGNETNTNTKNITSVNLNVYIGAQNKNNTVSLPSNRQCAFASIGDGLTGTEASNFYTSVQSFQTALSRQV